MAFPLKMPLLTYELPSGAPSDMTGRIVRAPLIGRSIAGLVVNTCNEPEVTLKKNIKAVQNIYKRVMSSSAIAFHQWLADYYLSPVGNALRSGFFDEIAAHVIRGPEDGQIERASIEGSVPSSFSPVANNPALEAICESMRLNGYRSFLYHAGSSVDEKSLLTATLTYLRGSLSNAVILVPEIAQLESILPALLGLFGERVCVLHSKLGRKETAATIRRIMSGASDIIVGTRSAVLAPLRKVSFIAVLSEHSRSYKAEEGLRYNGRDVAVMRGFYEKATVLLSSICPSVESVYNTAIGKYVMLNQMAGTEQGQVRPKIKIVPLKTGGTSLFLAPEIIKEAGNLTARGKRFLFLVSNKGYSFLRCEECGFVERCRTCDVPLIYYKNEDALKCRYCGVMQGVSESCANCSGVEIKAYGAGIDRVKEQVGVLLKAEALVIEKGRTALTAYTERSAELAPLVVGTGYAKGLAYKRDGEEKPFGAAAFLNMDALLLRPDFRLYERAIQEIMAVAQMVSNEGTLFLQTKLTQNKVLRFIRSYDFSGFYRYELSQRKEFNNPPYSRLILFTLPVRNEPGKLLIEVQRVAAGLDTSNVEVFGPVELPYHSKKYHFCIQVLMKSKERTALHDEAKSLLRKLGKLKVAKIIVDVDPLDV
ncbi:MAG: primosomal protein N' [Nitrospirae bacterium]|nr:primosomal protein N' [Nitrospirota bacterium]